MNRLSSTALWAALCISVSAFGCAEGQGTFLDPERPSLGTVQGAAGGPMAPQPSAESAPCQTDLLCAQPLNVLAFGDYVGGVEVGGKIAVAGTLQMSSFRVGHAAAGGKAIVAGALDLEMGSVFGSAVHQGGANVSHTVDLRTDGVVKHGKGFDFDVCESRICSKSQEIGAMATNGVTQIETKGTDTLIHFVGIAAGVNVFRIDADWLSEARRITVTVPKSATAIINVTGDFLSLSSHQIFAAGQTDYRKIVWNLPEASKIDIYGYHLLGSVLACKASVWFEQGQMRGTLVAREIEGNGAFHHSPFMGCLP